MHSAGPSASAIVGAKALARKVQGSYMDVPFMPSLFFGSGFQVEIAAIHWASVYGAWPRALMEYAG
jgi:hypothetical protein